MLFQVLGIDKNKDMVDVCQELHQDVPNLSFQAIDLENLQQCMDFVQQWGGRAALVTAFFSLYLDQAHSSTAKFFHDCLKKYGKFLCTVPVALTDTSPYVQVFLDMKADEHWQDKMVANANQRLTNHGPILPNDLQTTLESQGFQSEQIKEMLFPNFNLPPSLLKQGFQHEILFPGLLEEDNIQEEFKKR